MRKRAEKGSLETFLRRAKKRHKNKFDYSRILSIRCLKDKAEIECKDHGVFLQELDTHVKSKYGCPKCGRESMHFSKAHVLQKFRDRHGEKYDYSKVDRLLNYDKVTIICRKCGKEFRQVVRSHYRGSGCPNCNLGGKLNTKEFIKRSIKRHGSQFGYSKTTYKTTKSPIELYCKKCAKFFKTTPQSHLRKSGHGGCEFCGASEGEKRIVKLLENKRIEFEFQKRFKDCLLKYPLPFDFYVESENLAIEYHGRQHYFVRETRATKASKSDIFRLNLKRDGIKRAFCKKRGINLVVINPFNEGDLSQLLS